MAEETKKLINDFYSILSNYNAGRITPASLDFWDGQRREPLNTLVMTVLYENGSPIGVSGVNVVNKTTEFAVIAVNKYYRGKGLGKILLKETVEKLKNLDVSYQAIVADDNIASNGVMRSIGLKVTEQVAAKRQKTDSRGEDYTRITYKLE